jgi:nicotinamide-nucleotide amidase
MIRDDLGAATADAANRIASSLHGRLLACAESCTAGGVSAALAAVGGASDWLQGGLVAYRTQTKRSLLAVSASSVLTEEAAVEMAVGVARLLEAEVAVATTGVMGEEPEEGVPPGTIMVATAVDGDVRASTHHLDSRDPGDRCATAVEIALHALATHLATRL